VQQYLWDIDLDRADFVAGTSEGGGKGEGFGLSDAHESAKI